MALARVVFNTAGLAVTPIGSLELLLTGSIKNVIGLL